MILFKKIRYKNFLSTGNQWIEFKLNDVKTTLLFGKNGSGKSTFTDAITFALYGKSFRKINKPQLINNYNKGELVCELEFSVGSRDYKIVRGQKPNIFEIYENGKLINQNSNIQDDQEYLVNNILKMNYKSFVQIVVVGSATYVPFMQLTPNDRRLIVEDLLNIDIISKMNSLAKRYYSENNTKLFEIEREYDILNEKIKMHNKYVETNLQTINESIDRLIENINEQRGIEEEKEFQLKEIENDILNKNKEIKTLENKVILLNQLEEKKKKLLDKIKTLEASKKLFESELCSKCLQPISPKHKEEMIMNKNKEIEELNSIIKEIDDKLISTASIKENYNNMNKSISMLQSDKIKIESEIRSIRNFISKQENELKALKTKKNELIMAMKEDHLSMKESLQILVENKNQLVQQKEDYEDLLDILKDDGVKSKIIKYYLPKINKFINYYLSLMNFKIGFELTENFEEKILNLSKEGLSYENFSQGEKLRIDLAILFAWREIAKRENNISTNLLIMDEILDSSLDSEGISDFIKIIKQIIDDKTNNVFIISHKDEQIIDKFHKAYKFEKSDGRFSRVMAIAN